MEYDVFISYSRKDYLDEYKRPIPGNIISQIKELFDANNISYWFDEEGIYSGDAFAPVIARNIKASKIFLFVSSSNSNASEWTSNEIAVAYQYRKKIIPFRFDDSVYNDSVIMYIARLDYIEYLSNPSKALSRLLNSIQTYIKTEIEKKEFERQEEERRNQTEITKQERAIKLKNVRERIKHCENRKLEIEKDILIQEKSLSDLRNEKRILEAEIANLQEEEATLLVHNRVKKAAEPLPTHKTAILVKRNIQLPKMVISEWDEIKSAMALKHPIVNILCLIWIVASTLCFAIPAMLTVGSAYDVNMNICLSIAGYATMVGGHKLLKNFRNGYIWLLIANVFLGIAGWVDYWGFALPLFGVLAIGIYTLTLLIRKNGVSAMSLLKKEPHQIKNHKIQISIAVILLSFFVGNWIYREVNHIRPRINNNLSYEELENSRDILSPFYEHYYSDDKSKIDSLVREAKETKDRAAK